MPKLFPRGEFPKGVKAFWKRRSSLFSQLKVVQNRSMNVAIDFVLDQTGFEGNLVPDISLLKG